MIGPAVRAGLWCVAAIVLAGQASAQSPAGDAARLFGAKCAACHATGGWGTRTLARRVSSNQAELTSRRGLDPSYIKFVVRRGVGSMPQFTPTDLSDGELRTLSDWLAKRATAPSVSAESR